MILGYASIVITIIIMVLALYLLFKILPTVGGNRFKKGKIKFTRKEIAKNISLENNPPANDDSYMHSNCWWQ